MVFVPSHNTYEKLICVLTLFSSANTIFPILYEIFLASHSFTFFRASQAGILRLFRAKKIDSNSWKVFRSGSCTSSNFAEREKLLRNGENGDVMSSSNLISFSAFYRP